MTNELLLITNVILLYGGVYLAYKHFGVKGLFCWTVFATIMANIEVLILVNAFRMEQTLGNILFATTFLVTDILSENHGKKTAQQAVKIGISTAVMMILVTQMWLRYIPADSDWAMPSIIKIFANTPRLLIVSLLVYGISQLLDVFLYHKWWAITSRITGDRKKFLWIRNNGSTLISQLVNSFLYNFGAFYGVFEIGTLVKISMATYVIFIITSIIDTPVVYMARRLKVKKPADIDSTGDLM